MNTRRSVLKKRNKARRKLLSRKSLLAFIVVVFTVFSFLILLENVFIIEKPPPLSRRSDNQLRAVKHIDNIDNFAFIARGNNINYYYNNITIMMSAVTVKKAVDKLTELEINFLALDFDQTILDIHTGGAWKGSLEELFPHIRPVYTQLITAALATNEIEVAVVTFSCQTLLVRGVLDRIIEVGLDKETSNELGMIGIGGIVDTSAKIPIRGGDRTWRYNGSGSIDGKQPHMASAVEELETRREEKRSNSTSSESTSSIAIPPLPITRKSTLLLDDDHRNIR